MNRRQKWPVIAMAYTLLIMFFFGVITARKDITVFVDGQTLTGRALGGTVETYLEREGIAVADHDRVLPGRETYLENGLEILVERTVPVRVVCDGQENEYWVVADNAQEAVEDAGIVLYEKDKILPSCDTPVEAGLEIEVIRVTEEIYSYEVAIAFQTIQRNNGHMNRGTSKITQTGKDGLVRKTFLKTYENGVEVSNELIHEEILQKPVDQIVHIGTGGTITREGKTVRFTRVLDMIATGYWGDPAWSTGYTAIGMKARKGLVAVDPRVIPLRTWVYVEGYGFAYAADVGGAIKGNRIDLCFDNADDAWAVGRRRVTVYVLDM